jgi:hypothetical protein
MGTSIRSLEVELDNPNWKQWLPLVGQYLAYAAHQRSEPSLLIPRFSLSSSEIRIERPVRYFTWLAYQAIVDAKVISLAAYGLAQLGKQ